MAQGPRPPAADTGEALWRRVTATVKRLEGKRPPPRARGVEPAVAPRPDARAPLIGVTPAPRATTPVAVRAAKAPRNTPTLDSTWERAIRGGQFVPEMTVDLHGYHLAGAHVALGRALDRAVAHGVRRILIVAGKVRGPDEAPRGAIRRELESWLSHSPHADRIIALRNAHPRHGGAGSLYLILRR